MSNTGKKIVLTLKQINAQTFRPTGLTESNTPGSPDYIPPYNDFASCPITYNLACPVPIFSPYPNTIGIEFSLYNSVVNNPQVTNVRVNAITQSIVQGSTTFPTGWMPTPNYYSGSIYGLPSGTYTLNIQFLSGSTVLSTCNYTSSISV